MKVLVEKKRCWFMENVWKDVWLVLSPVKLCVQMFVG